MPDPVFLGPERLYFVTRYSLPLVPFLLLSGRSLGEAHSVSEVENHLGNYECLYRRIHLIMNHVFSLLF